MNQDPRNSHNVLTATILAASLALGLSACKDVAPVPVQPTATQAAEPQPSATSRPLIVEPTPEATPTHGKPLTKPRHPQTVKTTPPHTKAPEPTPKKTPTPKLCDQIGYGFLEIPEDKIIEVIARGLSKNQIDKLSTDENNVLHLGDVASISVEYDPVNETQVMDAFTEATAASLQITTKHQTPDDSLQAGQANIQTTIEFTGECLASRTT